MSKKTLAPSKVTVRDPKGMKFVSVVEAAYNKAGLTEKEAQMVNEASGLPDLVAGFIAANRNSNKYADEECKSNYEYPGEYRGPKPIEEQIKALAKILKFDPSHALDFAKSLRALPEGAEGWFAVPSVDALAAKHFPKVADPAEKYCQAVRLIHKKISASRSFYNYRKGQITPKQLRVSTRTLEALGKLAEAQKGDILIVAGQLGLRHAGKSVRRAREVFTANEFGLTILMIGSIILTHPERLVRWDELDMDCAGDEFSDSADGAFSRAPYFYCYDDNVRFDAYKISYYIDDYGAASAFLPQ